MCEVAWLSVWRKAQGNPVFCYDVWNPVLVMGGLRGSPRGPGVGGAHPCSRRRGWLGDSSTDPGDGRGTYVKIKVKTKHLQ